METLTEESVCLCVCFLPLYRIVLSVCTRVFVCVCVGLCVNARTMCVSHCVHMNLCGGECVCLTRCYRGNQETGGRVLLWMWLSWKQPACER